MNAKNTLIVLLALTTIGGGALAWHQYQELVGLRAAALSTNDRADLQKKIWDLQKANQRLEDELAAAHARAGAAGEDAMAEATGEPASADTNDRRDRRGGRAERFAAIREMMQKPEVQALMSTAQKAMVDARYAALFRTLNLSPDQADKLSQLLVDRQNAFRDVMQAARDQGVNPRSDPQGFQQLLNGAESGINDSIKSLLGDSGYSQLTNYDQTMPQRNVVNVLQQRLSYSSSPLSASQADQLVQILAANTPGGANGSGGNTGWAGGRGGFGGGMMEGGAVATIAGPGTAQITPQAVSQAGTVLDSTQLTTLQQLQQQQQAADQLRQIMRSTWQQANGAAAAGGTGTTGAQPGSTPATGTGGGRRGGGG